MLRFLIRKGGANGAMMTLSFALIAVALKSVALNHDTYLTNTPVAATQRANHHNLQHNWSLGLSTEENYAEENYASSNATFAGKYSSIRQGLDYTYHDIYSQSRQRLQDNIVDSILNHAIIQDNTGKHCVRPQVPWIVFTAGAMGAGKSHVIQTLKERGYFPLQAFVLVDPDHIRRQLPEYDYYEQNYPEEAGLVTQKEAGLIAEIAIQSGLDGGYNILVDGSLSNATWYETYIPTLRQHYPTLQLAILHVSAPRDVVLTRAKDRATATGRVVPHELLETTMERVPQSVAQLAPMVDFCVEIDNSGTGDLFLVTGMDWDSFRRQWTQRCAIGEPAQDTAEFRGRIITF